MAYRLRSDNLLHWTALSATWKLKKAVKNAYQLDKRWGTVLGWIIRECMDKPQLRIQFYQFLSASLYCVVTSLVVGWLVVTRVHCHQTVHPRPSYYGTLIGNPTSGIQWYNFRPPGVTPNRGMGPPWGAFRLFVKLLWPLVYESCTKNRLGHPRSVLWFGSHIENLMKNPATPKSIPYPHIDWSNKRW